MLSLLNLFFSLTMSLTSPQPATAAATAPAKPTKPPVTCHCGDLGQKDWR